MSRPLRIEFPGAFYHVMNRGLNKNLIFLDDESDRHLLKETIFEAVERWRIRVHAFSLMNNHYHLLIETPLASLSRAMRHIDGVFTQRFNRRYHRDGPLFRGRFKSILVEKESYFLELVRYIHLNGVKAKVFPSPQTDFHSSHWDYLHPHQAAPWLEQSLVLSYFQKLELAPREALHQFVLQGIPESLETILSNKKWPAVLGLKSFVSVIRETYLKSPHNNRELPQKNHLLRTRRLSPAIVIRMVSEAYEKTALDSREHKWATMYFLRKHSFLTLKDIGVWMGGLSYKSVQHFLNRNNFLNSNIVLYLDQALGNVAT